MKHSTISGLGVKIKNHQDLILVLCTWILIIILIADLHSILMFTKNHGWMYSWILPVEINHVGISEYPDVLLLLGSPDSWHYVVAGSQ